MINFVRLNVIMPSSSAFTSYKKNASAAAGAIGGGAKGGGASFYSPPISGIGSLSAVPTTGRSLAITQKSVPVTSDANIKTYQSWAAYGPNTNIREWSYTTPPGTTQMLVTFSCPLGMFTVTVDTVPGMVFPIKALSNGSMIEFGIPNLYSCIFNSLTGEVKSNHRSIRGASGIMFVISRETPFFFTITAQTTATVTDPQSYLGGPVDFYPYACIESGRRYINDSYSGNVVEIKSDDSTIPIPEYTGGAVFAVAIGPGGSAQGVDKDYDWDFGGGGGGLAWGVIDASLYNYELPVQVSGPLSSGGGESGKNISVATIVGTRDGNLPYILGHAGNSPDRGRNNDGFNLEKGLTYAGAPGGLEARCSFFGGDRGGFGYGPHREGSYINAPHRGGGGGAGGYGGRGGNGQRGAALYATESVAQDGKGGAGGGGGDYSVGGGCGFYFYDNGLGEPARANGAGGRGQSGTTREGANYAPGGNGSVLAPGFKINTIFTKAYGGGGSSDYAGWGGQNQHHVNGMGGGIFIGWFKPRYEPIRMPIPIYLNPPSGGLNALRDVRAYPTGAINSFITDNDFFISSSQSTKAFVVRTPRDPTDADFYGFAYEISNSSKSGHFPMWVENQGYTIYMCDPKNNMIVRMNSGANLNGRYDTEILAGGPGDKGVDLDDPASIASFLNPTQIVYNSFDNSFFVVDDGSRIRRIDMNGNVTTPFYISNLSIQAVLPFSREFCYIAFQDSVYKWNYVTNENPTIVFGSGEDVSGHVNGTNLDARFNDINCMILDNYGNIIIGENSNYIRKVVVSGDRYVVSDLCTIPLSYFNVMSGKVEVTSLTVDVNNILYMTLEDGGYSNIIQYDGYSVSVFAGQYGGGYNNGSLSESLFTIPRGLYYDKRYNIMYVADSSNDVIRYITMANSVVHTLSGVNGTGGQVNTKYGTPTFNNPLSLTMDSAGNIYVADNFNFGIRKITSRV